MSRQNQQSESGADRSTFSRVPEWIRPAFVLFAIAWGGNEFTPLLIMYKQNQGFSSQTVNILLGAYVIGIIPALLLGGPMSDRFGRRPLLMPAPILGMLGSAVLALGPDSPLMLFIGRTFSGLALGLAMAVGTSWIKELSEHPYEIKNPGQGAKRASITLTAGFGLGAAAAAGLAQWGPWQTFTPFAVNILITVPSLVLLVRAAETRQRVHDGSHWSVIDSLRVPKVFHKRFLFIVVPIAPWIFGCAASAYAILPSVVNGLAGDAPIGFSGLLCIVALSAGVAIQPLAGRLDVPGGARGPAVALGVTFVGMLLSALATNVITLPTTLLACVVLGAAYGMLLVGGLREVQRIAGPDDLAGLTAMFYSLSYLGFFIPAILTYLTRYLTYPAMFAGGAVVSVVSLVVVVVGNRVTGGARAARRVRAGNSTAATDSGSAPEA